jgi:hypothetical protein
VDGYFVDAIKYNDLKSKSAFFGAREHVNIMRETGPHMSDADLALCKSLERKLIIRG